MIERNMMKAKIFYRLFVCYLCVQILYFILPISAWAGELFLAPQDFLISIAAHMILFLAFSYLYLFIKRTIGAEKDWRYLYWGLFFFAIWSFQHMVEQLLGFFMLSGSGYFNDDYLIMKNPLSLIYYLLKITRTPNRLIAMIFIYLGIRNLRLKEEEKKSA